MKALCRKQGRNNSFELLFFYYFLMEFFLFFKLFYFFFLIMYSTGTFIASTEIFIHAKFVYD